MFLRDRAPKQPDEPASDRAGSPTGGAWAADLILAQGAARRDRDALDRFVVRMRCVPRFVAHLDRRAGSLLGREAHEDLVQDVLATVWRRLPEYRGEAAIETWVFRICDFQMRNAHRRARPRQGVSLEDLAEPAAVDTGSDDDHEALQAAIESLPAAEAEVLRLKHHAGLTFDQIASQLRVSPNTVKTRYYRGLEALRRRLRKPEGER